MLKSLNLFYQYSEGLKSAPVYTKMVSIGLIYLSADFLCQVFSEKRKVKTYSTGRTLRHTMIGTFFVAPALHVWHSHFIPTLTFPFKTRKARIIASYLLGELVLAPIFLASLLFIYEADRTRSTEAGKKLAKDKLWPTLKEYYKRWTLVSLFTYSVVPIPFRPIFTSLYGIQWQMYLSHVTNETPSVRAIKENQAHAHNEIR